MNYKKAILVLIILTTVVPELVTGSTPVFKFFNPTTLLVLFVGYGLAVLVVREISVRWNLNFAGVYLLGVAYAVINEGLLAKTMLRSANLPTAQYNHYGYAAGISFPWTFSISAWHAAASVLIPIVLTYIIFPDLKDKPWVGKKTLFVLSLFVLLFSTLFFFNPLPVRGTVPQYIILALMMAFWLVMATLLGKRKEENFSPAHPASALKPFLLGLSILVFFFVLMASLAEHKVAPVLFAVILAIGIWLYMKILKSREWTNIYSLGMFGMGLYVQQAALGIALGLWTNYSLLTLTDIVLLIVFVVAAFKIKKRSQALVAA